MTLHDPRVWLPEEAAGFDYIVACSLCWAKKGDKIEYGERVVDLEDPRMIRRMVDDQPEMIETVIAASNDEGTVLFICHERCAKDYLSGAFK